MHEVLFDTLAHLKGPVSKEIERLALSSLQKKESTKMLRSLLPSQYGFSEQRQQSLCEFREALFERIDYENTIANPLINESALSEKFHFKNQKFWVCETCHWTQIGDTFPDVKVCYFPVPGVLNPDAPTCEEEIDSTDIPFHRVLNLSLIHI